MSRDQFNRNTLTDDQYLRLVEILKSHETFILQSDFPEQVLQLLEDVPGLELMSDSASNHIIQKLWSLYYGQDK